MLKYFKPQNINSKKIRLGSQRDGGYVAPEIILENCSCLFTYGYGGDKTYEDDFIAKYNKPNYIFDHTVQQNSWDIGIQHFIPEGLGINQEGGNVKTVRQHYDQFNILGDIFLKIDTEGAEFDYFLNVDIDDLASFTCGIIVEVHWLEQETNQIKFIEMMEKINKHFTLVHIHGNNWGEEFDYEGFKVPRVPEFTFVNKRYITECSPDNQDYPIEGIDFPNNPNAQECDLSFLKEF